MLSCPRRRQRRFPLRHGADDPDHAARAAPHLRRGRARHATGPGPLIRLDPQWRCFFDDGTRARPGRERRGHGAPSWTRFAPGTLGRGLPPTSHPLRAAARDLRPILLLEVGRGHLATRSTSRRTVEPRHLRDVLACAWARTVAGTVIREATCRTPARPDARPLHASMSARRPTGRRRCSARSPTCRPSEGVWYPMGGTRAVAEGLAKLAAHLGVELRPDTEVPPHRSPARAARCRGRDRRRRDGRPATPSSPTWTRSAPTRAGRRRRRRASSSAGARRTSRPAPASCSISG